MDGGDGSKAALKTQVERLVKKVKYMESGRKWNMIANEKQFNYQMEVKQIVMDNYWLTLEEHFGGKKRLR